MAGISIFLTVLQVSSAIFIVVLVLLQHGKGADMGAAFGSGASGSLFGASGASNFLSRMTAISVTIFFASTLFIGLGIGAGKQAGLGVLDGYQPTQSTEKPVQQSQPAQQNSVPAAASLAAPAAADTAASKPQQIPQ